MADEEWVIMYGVDQLGLNETDHAETIEGTDTIYIQEEAGRLHNSIPVDKRRAPEHDRGTIRAYRVKLAPIIDPLRPNPQP
jgi:hypothetical protein